MDERTISMDARHSTFAGVDQRTHCRSCKTPIELLNGETIEVAKLKGGEIGRCSASPTTPPDGCSKKYQQKKYNKDRKLWESISALKARERKRKQRGKQTQHLQGQHAEALAATAQLDNEDSNNDAELLLSFLNSSATNQPNNEGSTIDEVSMHIQRLLFLEKISSAGFLKDYVRNDCPNQDCLAEKKLYLPGVNETQCLMCTPPEDLLASRTFFPFLAQEFLRKFGGAGSVYKKDCPKKEKCKNFPRKPWYLRGLDGEGVACLECMGLGNLQDQFPALFEKVKEGKDLNALADDIGNLSLKDPQELQILAANVIKNYPCVTDSEKQNNGKP